MFRGWPPAPPATSPGPLPLPEPAPSKSSPSSDSPVSRSYDLADGKKYKLGSAAGS
ncbi:hypothetical protein K440DRAFT_627528 [Wilcoxina mikolae CBS 423.85]|nr:hypothetical protein K440DRAFT_627528 [Wilcoxina mikolae CBS 423.85]